MRKHRGVSYLELQVAFALFGIALAGLAPLVVVQSRHIRQVESRFSPGTTHYLVPSTSKWARKLGAAASVQTVNPGPPPPPPVTLIDDGDAGYSEVGNDWHSHSEDTFNSDVRCNHEGDGSERAVWEFAGLEAGEYRVLVTWKSADNLASLAPYTVYDGSTSLGTIIVDQMNDPSGAVFAGVPWENLGVFSIHGDTLRVELSDNADDKVWADAARIVPVRGTVEVLALDKSVADLQITARVLVTPP